MKKLFNILLSLFVLFCLISYLQGHEESPQRIAIIPQPAKITQEAGVFHLNHKTKIAVAGKLKFKAGQLVGLLKPAIGYNLPIVEPTTDKNKIIQ